MDRKAGNKFPPPKCTVEAGQLTTHATKPLRRQANNIGHPPLHVSVYAGLEIAHPFRVAGECARQRNVVQKVKYTVRDLGAVRDVVELAVDLSLFTPDRARSRRCVPPREEPPAEQEKACIYNSIHGAESQLTDIGCVASPCAAKTDSCGPVPPEREMREYSVRQSKMTVVLTGKDIIHTCEELPWPNQQSSLSEYGSSKLKQCCITDF